MEWFRLILRSVKQDLAIEEYLLRTKRKLMFINILYSKLMYYTLRYSNIVYSSLLYSTLLYCTLLCCTLEGCLYEIEHFSLRVKGKVEVVEELKNSTLLIAPKLCQVYYR